MGRHEGKEVVEGEAVLEGVCEGVTVEVLVSVVEGEGVHVAGDNNTVPTDTANTPGIVEQYVEPQIPQAGQAAQMPDVKGQSPL